MRITLFVDWPQHRHRDARNTGQLARVVVHLNLPDLRGAANVNRLDGARDPAAGDTANMVGVDVQPHAPVSLGAGAYRSARAQSFGKNHAYPAVQQAVGLAGAPVDRYAGFEVVVTHFGELNAQVRYRGIQAPGGEQFKRDRSFPDGHGGLGVVCKGDLYRVGGRWSVAKWTPDNACVCEQL